MSGSPFGALTEFRAWHQPLDSAYWRTNFNSDIVIKATHPPELGNFAFEGGSRVAQKILLCDLSRRSPSHVAAAVSWYLHPLRAALGDNQPNLKLRPAPNFRVLVFSKASASTVLRDPEPMGQRVLRQEPFLIEQKTRYDIERNLDFPVYKHYIDSVMIFLDAHDEATIRSKYRLEEIEFVDFRLDEINDERKTCIEAFSAYRERYELSSHQAEQSMKNVVDDLVTPKFLELSQQVTGLFARQTEEIRSRTKEIPEMNRKLDELIAKLKL